MSYDSAQFKVVDGDPLAHRTLPHNLEAEQGLLGMLLIDNRNIEKVSDKIKPEHFSHPTHGKIYDTILRMIDKGLEAKATTLKDYFEKDEGLATVGGTRYLVELATEVPLLNDIKDYADTIYDRHMRREIIRFNQDVSSMAFSFSMDQDADNIIAEAESRLFKLAETGSSGQTGFVTLRDSVKIALEHAEKAYHADSHVTGVTTGLVDLDHKLGGLHNSDLLILAARPSMGKTSLAVNIAFNAAKAFAENKVGGGRVGFFSLEMSSDQLATRIISDCSGISGDAIRKGNIKEHEFISFVQASQKLSTIPLYIDDTPALSIGQVRARARRLKRQHGLDLLIVDYLQLLQGSGTRQSEGNRVLEISEITRGLKAIAKELSIPVIALSQLSRAVEQREDNRPMLSDLRESGSIEQDADVVMFIYRHEYYLSRREPQKSGANNEKFNDQYQAWQEQLAESANVAEVIVAKQRHGPIGTVQLFFDSNITRFGDLEKRYG
ncbi:MAG: replicative DNA helicase [Micavibrio aeruginosavorus]|uniref:Replicative DNA helicase n=1 Tax=Micavibrio aeruginosavorus TaxID=349221 RepID=A0A2W5PVI8_9BACT|nr:MAG: replicative DNA helicase [Micavibrio aeruginosavorus]